MLDISGTFFLAVFVKLFSLQRRESWQKTDPPFYVQCFQNPRNVSFTSKQFPLCFDSCVKIGKFSYFKSDETFCFYSSEEMNNLIENLPAGQHFFTFFTPSSWVTLTDLGELTKPLSVWPTTMPNAVHPSNSGMLTTQSPVLQIIKPHLVY